MVYMINMRESEKEVKDKFVRWTATFKELKYKDQIRLQEEGLPEIRANFDEDIPYSYNFKKEISLRYHVNPKVIIMLFGMIRDGG